MPSLPSRMARSLDPALDDAGNGLPLQVIAEEIVRDLRSARKDFTVIARSLGGKVDVAGGRGRLPRRVDP